MKSIITPVPHDPSEIILIYWCASQKNDIFNYMLKTVVLLHISVENHVERWYIFSRFFDE